MGFILKFLICTGLACLSAAFVHRDPIPYDLIPARFGAFAYHRKVLDSKVPLKIVFVGPSNIQRAVDARLVQRELFPGDLGTSVALLGHNWRSEDLIYAEVRDLLKAASPPIIVVSPPNTKSYRLSPYSGLFFDTIKDWRLFEDATLALQFFASKLLTAPKILLGLKANSADVALLEKSHGFLPFEEDREEYFSNADSPLNEIRVSRANWKPLGGEEGRLNTVERAFTTRLIALAREKGARIIFLEIPRVDEDWETPSLRTDLLALAPEVLGFSVNRLFEGMPREEVLSHFHDRFHFSLKGARRFTGALIPYLREIHEDEIASHDP